MRIARIASRFVEFDKARILVTLLRALLRMLMGNQDKPSVATILVLATSVGGCPVSFSLCKCITRLLLSVRFEQRV